MSRLYGGNLNLVLHAGDPLPPTRPEGHGVRCDGCDRVAAVRDSTDLPLTWAARVQGTRVVHYCPECDPGPSVGKSTVPAHA